MWTEHPNVKWRLAYNAFWIRSSLAPDHGTLHYMAFHKIFLMGDTIKSETRVCPLMAVAYNHLIGLKSTRSGSYLAKCQTNLACPFYADSHSWHQFSCVYAIVSSHGRVTERLNPVRGNMFVFVYEEEFSVSLAVRSHRRQETDKSYSVSKLADT